MKLPKEHLSRLLITLLQGSHYLCQMKQQLLHLRRQNVASPSDLPLRSSLERANQANRRRAPQKLSEGKKSSTAKTDRCTAVG